MKYPVNTSEEKHQASIPYILNTKSHFLSIALHSHCNWKLLKWRPSGDLETSSKLALDFEAEMESLLLVAINQNCIRDGLHGKVQFSSIQSLSCVRLFATPWITAHQASLSITNSRSLPRLQWHPTPVLLPGKSHGWRSLVGCSPWGR